MRSMWMIMISLVLAGTLAVSAEEPAPMTPIMLSFATPAQAPSPEFDVAGLRLNLLYGKCRNLTGLDVGLVNHATGKVTGLEVGLVNYAEKGFTGLQVGAVNIAGRVTALQVGLYNGGDDVSGVQIGLINHTRIMRGCQIGLINVIENNDLSFLPIFNCFF